MTVGMGASSGLSHRLRGRRWLPRLKRQMIFPRIRLLSLVTIVATPLLADTVVSIVPISDAFVREQAPTLNYGGGGGVCVGGPNSVNGAGAFRGRFDSLLRFETAAMIATFDTAYGPGQWSISSVTMTLTEAGAPTHNLFPRGLGAFGVRWLSEDGWSEGAGTPAAPETGAGDVITWNLLQALVAAGTETSLGGAANSQTDSTFTFPLAPEAAFISDVTAGGSVTLHMFPASDLIGFTFRAREQADPLLRPTLTFTAVPEPSSLWLILPVLAAARRRVATGAV